jgi:hypothetical protein
VERGQTGRSHVAAGDERFDAPDVDPAPDTARSAWSEAIGVGDVVDLLPDPVDPAVTEGDVQCRRVRDASPSGVLAVEADPQLALGRVVLVELGVQLDRRAKNSRCDGALCSRHRVPRGLLPN